MRTGFLVVSVALAAMSLVGCGEGTTSSANPAPFELQGSWLFLGPWDGEHTLTVGSDSMVYAGIAADWASHWTIKDYDNGLHHFQLVFESGTGAYSPTGQNFSGTYDLNSAILTVQLTDGLGTYSPVQSAGSCTDGQSNRITNCSLYMKQN